MLCYTDLDYRLVPVRLDGLTITLQGREERKGDAAGEPGHTFREEKAKHRHPGEGVRVLSCWVHPAPLAALLVQ